MKMTIRRLARTGVIGAAMLCMAAGRVAFAHHSFAMFDMKTTQTISGTVKDYQWTNPHVWIDLVVTDPATHQQSTYAVECGGTAILERMGWTRHSLKAGDPVAVVVNPLKHGVGGSLVSASVAGARIGHDLKF